MESLHRQVLPFLLRRLKDDVLQDLPPKIIQDYYCDLSPLQVNDSGLQLFFFWLSVSQNCQCHGLAQHCSKTNVYVLMMPCNILKEFLFADEQLLKYIAKTEGEHVLEEFQLPM